MVRQRKEIPKSVKRVVFERAGGPKNVTCEECGLKLGSKRFDYDHTIPEWLQDVPPSERPPIQPEDVKLLGVECCHKQKTAKEAGERAHGNRIRDNAARASSPKGRSFANSRNGPYKTRLTSDGPKTVRR